MFCMVLVVYLDHGWDVFIRYTPVLLFSKAVFGIRGLKLPN